MKKTTLATFFAMAIAGPCAAMDQQTYMLQGNEKFIAAATRHLTSEQDPQPPLSVLEGTVLAAVGVTLNGAMMAGASGLVGKDRFVPLVLPSAEILRTAAEGAGALVSCFVLYKGWTLLKQVLWLPQERRLQAVEDLARKLAVQVDHQQGNTHKRFEHVEALLSDSERRVLTTMRKIFAGIDARRNALVARQTATITTLSDLIKALETGAVKPAQLREQLALIKGQHEATSADLGNLLAVSKEEISELTTARHTSVAERIKLFLQRPFRKSDGSSCA